MQIKFYDLRMIFEVATSPPVQIMGSKMLQTEHVLGVTGSSEFRKGTSWSIIQDKQRTEM